MEYIYVCSPDGGLEENYIKALNYCRYVKSKNKVPISPVTMNHGVYDWRVPDERAAAKAAGRELLKLCSEVWVFGQKGIKEIGFLSSVGKPVRHIEDSFSFNDRSEMLSVLFNEYQNKTGRIINRKIMDDIVFYLDEGMSDKLILVAINKAANRSAGWEYAEGVLKNCLSRGITTAEEAKNKKVKKEKADYAAYNLEAFEYYANNISDGTFDPEVYQKILNGEEKERQHHTKQAEEDFGAFDLDAYEKMINSKD